MEKIEIKVTKTNISLTNGYVLNQGEYQVDKCKFTFSEEYEDLVKKAVFVNGDTGIDMVILNDECDIPYEILQTANEFTLKVYGYQVQDEELVQRYSPTALKIFLREGSYVGSNEVITPSQFEQYEQALHDGLDEIDDKMQEIETEVDGKIQEVDDKLTEVDGKIDEVDTAITETNNLDLNVSDKVGKDVTITLTKKDASTKTVTLSDGTSLMFNWQGTSLGIKTDEDEEYTYVNLQGQIGPIGPQGDPFQVKKTYANVDLMIADYDNMEINDYVMISGDIEAQDNATLWVKTETPAVTTKWVYLADFSGASGIQGPTGATPNIQIGTVVSGSTPSVTRTGTNENPVLNFTLVKGDTGGDGPQGPTGNGIATIQKTSTSGLVDTYTITFTNGNTTTFEVTNGEDGEVTQAQLDETNERVERAEMVYNALPKVNGSGEVVSLDNTAETPLKMELSGNTSQFSTTGKQLFNVNGSLYTGSIDKVNNGFKLTNDGTYRSLSIYLPNSIPAGTYKITYEVKNSTVSSINKVSGSLRNSSGGVGSFTFNNNTEASVTISEAADRLYIFIASDEASGATITLDNFMISTTGGDYEPYTNGASPNPDYPQDIEVVSGNNKVVVCGKNIFNDKNKINGYFEGNGTILSGGGSRNCIYYFPCQPSTAYSFSFSDYQHVSIIKVSYTEELPDYGVSVGSMTGITLTNKKLENYQTPANAKYVVIRLQAEASYDSQTNPITDFLTNFQIEQNTTATTYEPYQSQEYSVNLGSLELCKIGDYKDYIYKDNGSWYKYKEIGKVTLNGSESSWFKSSSTITDRFVYELQTGTLSNYSNVALSNYFTYNLSTSSQGNVGEFYLYSSGSNTRLFIDYSTYNTTTLADFKTWLGTHNTSVYYQLATPTNEPITDTTLINQLNAIEKAYAYQNQTNISQQNNDKPFVIDAETVRDLSNIFDI